MVSCDIKLNSPLRKRFLKASPGRGGGDRGWSKGCGGGTVKVLG